jgi:hypothetical protein
MKMYYFTNDGYSTHYTVMAENERQALEDIKHFLFNRWKGAVDGEEMYGQEYREWKDASVDKLPDNGRDPWRIEEYEPGQVLETERS